MTAPRAAIERRAASPSSALHALTPAAEHLLARIAAGRNPAPACKDPDAISGAQPGARRRAAERPASASGGAAADELVGAELAERGCDGRLAVTAIGRAHFARRNAALRGGDIDGFRAQHLALAARDIEGPGGREGVMVDEGESPLAWLARRKGRNGRPLIELHQLAAGERLRAEFTRAQLMPRVTSNWQAAVSRGARGAVGGGAAAMTDIVVAARQRVHQALDALGPEFAGLLIDVCCFLKGLEDIERERVWPSRSAKIVLQLGLECLARHYGLAAQVRGTARARTLTWHAPPMASQDVTFVSVDG
jgi:hypothetical protein